MFNIYDIGTQFNHNVELKYFNIPVAPYPL